MTMLQSLIPTATQNIDITGLCVDSRRVEPGFLFAAFPGSKVDGRTYIDQAIKAGASAILAPIGTRASVPVIEDANPRRTFAYAAARFYDQQPALCAAVTGTNGKSSCVTFIRQLWAMLDIQAASLGTLGITAPNMEIAGGLTTPDPAGLHERLAEIAHMGVTHLAMEASSHGLDQYRLDGVNVQIAAFTNLSRDHLDYHPDMENYLSAKERLFSDVLRPHGKAVLNADAPEFSRLSKTALAHGHQVISYGRKGHDIQLLDVQTTHDGQDLILLINGREFKIMLPLAGYFQIENALCSLGVVMASGIEAEQVIPLLAKLEGVPGRMELIGRGVYVDYAHTPDALETVLKALRPHAHGQLCVLFGCGGDRDKGKRPEMGRIAKEFADRIYVSDDNPRSEDADTIRREIMAACPQAIEIGDRKAAIEKAINDLQNGDILVLAGKGHETGQIVGDHILPFDDRAIAREVIHA
ncbi:MAG: UDP-N-acetylmuramoyl-L-alanyl-D-glutamate--2,6-diaminopimelate ligase [Methylocystaceae bacterium]|nr:UDP-N-acetylmuramoyl-L-alanyl-D-glutamate--2,6-diaminopimelate ligase [Methylocystaceae bacterium]